MDRMLGKEPRSLKKIGIKFQSTSVKEVKAAGRSVTVMADNKKGEEQTFKAEYCLVVWVVSLSQQTKP